MCACEAGGHPWWSWGPNSLLVLPCALQRFSALAPMSEILQFVTQQDIAATVPFEYCAQGCSARGLLVEFTRIKRRSAMMRKRSCLRLARFDGCFMSMPPPSCGVLSDRHEASSLSGWPVGVKPTGNSLHRRARSSFRQVWLPESRHSCIFAMEENRGENLNIADFPVRQPQLSRQLER